MKILLLSLVLALVPLAGIGYLVSNGELTVDALFMSLILLAISGIFLRNAVQEARSRDLLALGRSNSAQKTEKAAAQKAAS